MLGLAVNGNAGSLVVPMSTNPHSVTDLALAPVLINIERNLARLRETGDLEYELALELNDDSGWYSDPAGRARRVREAAIRDVDVHGWTIEPTADHQGLAVQHGGYQVSVMLGSRLSGYIETGTFGIPSPAGAAR